MEREHKLNSSLKTIIDLFQRHQFQPRTLQQISAELGEKENTINQRIIRDENYYFHSEGTKPKIISLNLHRSEVLAHIYHNQCQSCKKMVKPALIRSFFKDGNKENKLWGNIIPVCQECYEKLQKDKDKPTSKTSKRKESEKFKILWDYKVVRIKTQLEPAEKFFVFNDNEADDFPFDDYFWLEDEGKINSYYLKDILDYFGQNGWELVGIRDLSKDHPQGSFSIEFAVTPFYDPKYIELECYFKRQTKAK